MLGSGNLCPETASEDMLRSEIRLWMSVILGNRITDGFR
jgi:hypothetical protein